MKNPWCKVSAEDYETHMSHENVRQTQFIFAHFQHILKKYSPSHVMVLGACTGNGFEHFDPIITEEVLAVDVNQEYLQRLKSRFQNRIPNLQCFCGSFPEDFKNPKQTYELIYGSLFFEYVDLDVRVGENWTGCRSHLK